MSTKKKIIDVFKNITDIGMPKLAEELARLNAELERKRNTPLTHALLVNNGAEYVRDKEWDEISYIHLYLLDFPLVLQRIGADFFITETDIQLKTVADLEDTLDLCGIDKEIEL